MSRILVVEDEQHLADGLRYNLEAEQYDVDLVESGEEALQRLTAEPGRYDLVILDVMLPGIDGFTVASQLREARRFVPVLMLTARGRSEDVLRGFGAGADDYLAKPFEPEELLLRIEAILRRSQDRPIQNGPLLLGRCAFDPDRGELTCDGEPVRLTEAEVALMRELARTPHEPVDRLALARGASDPSGRAVDVQVTRLRRKIEDDPKAPRYLQTVRGVGYRLAPD